MTRRSTFFWLSTAIIFAQVGPTSGCKMRRLTGSEVKAGDVDPATILIMEADVQGWINQLEVIKGGVQLLQAPGEGDIARLKATSAPSDRRVVKNDKVAILEKMIEGLSSQVIVAKGYKPGSGSPEGASKVTEVFPSALNKLIDQFTAIQDTNLRILQDDILNLSLALPTSDLSLREKAVAESLVAALNSLTIPLQVTDKWKRRSRPVTESERVPSASDGLIVAPDLTSPNFALCQDQSEDVSNLKLVFTPEALDEYKGLNPEQRTKMLCDVLAKNLKSLVTETRRSITVRDFLLEPKGREKSLVTVGKTGTFAGFSIEEGLKIPLKFTDADSAAGELSSEADKALCSGGGKYAKNICWYEDNEKFRSCLNFCGTLEKTIDDAARILFSDRNGSTTCRQVGQALLVAVGLTDANIKQDGAGAGCFRFDSSLVGETLGYSFPFSPFDAHDNPTICGCKKR